MQRGYLHSETLYPIYRGTIQKNNIPRGSSYRTCEGILKNFSKQTKSTRSFQSLSDRYQMPPIILWFFKANLRKTKWVEATMMVKVVQSHCQNTIISEELAPINNNEKIAIKFNSITNDETLKTH